MAYPPSKWELSLGGWGGGDNKTATLADFSPATTGGMEKHFLNNIDMFPAGRYPFSVDFMKRTIRSRNLVFPMVCGEEHYPGRNITRGGRLI